MRPGLCLAAWLAAAPMPASAQSPRSAFEYERFQLANGLDVVLHRLAHVPVVTVMTTYRVGSANEARGRSGFAHLFEHLMFKGSKHVPPGKYAEWLVDAGGGANGATTYDATVYANWVAAEGVELALYLDAERMAYLRDGLTNESLVVEREVVKNERRLRIDNRPYGDAFLILAQALFGEQHPYASPPIGSMADISAATLEEVVTFHQTYYVPNNAILVVVGDIDVKATRAMVTKWYGSIPRGAVPPSITARPPQVPAEVRLQKEEDVQLPRLYVAWPTPPLYSAGQAVLDVAASLLGSGSAGRLRERLVNELGIAQDLTVFQESNGLASGFYIVATARPGYDLDQVDTAIQDEIRRLQAVPPDARELTRIVNTIESNLLSGIEGTGGRADRISSYLRHTGLPDFFQEDLARYRALTPRDLTDAAISFLPLRRRVVLSIVPQGKPELGVANSMPARSAYR